MVAQALELSRKPHVVIATPGRLADHLRSSNTFSLKKLKFLVRQFPRRFFFLMLLRFVALWGCVRISSVFAAMPRFWMRLTGCWSRAALTSPRTWR